MIIIFRVFDLIGEQKEIYLKLNKCLNDEIINDKKKIEELENKVKILEKKIKK